MDANFTSEPNDNSPHAGLASKPIERDGHSRTGMADRRGPLRAPEIDGLPVAAFCCDPRGAVVSHNAAAAELWGRESDPAEPGKWCGAHSLLDVGSNPLARSEFPTARAVAGRFDLDSEEFLIEREDGSRRRIEAHPKLARGENGAIAGAFCVLIDTTERARLAEELRRRDDDKDAFLSLLAHELRNPLAPILSAAHVMRKVSDDGRVRGMADVVERQAKQLARFVADLLDASNLAQEGIALRLRPVPLSQVLACALDVLRPHAAARGQRVAVEFEDLGSTAYCDPERTSQAIANVMVNASAFTGEGGDISVRVRIDSALLDVEVEDTGIGIDPDEIGEVFKPYSQFATHADRLRSGAGLGLAIAKDICEGHGGLISASSPGRGRGSRFRMILPVVHA